MGRGKSRLMVANWNHQARRNPPPAAPVCWEEHEAYEVPGVSEGAPLHGKDMTRGIQYPLCSRKKTVTWGWAGTRREAHFVGKPTLPTSPSQVPLHHRYEVPVSEGHKVDDDPSMPEESPRSGQTTPTWWVSPWNTSGVLWWLPSEQTEDPICSPDPQVCFLP